MKKQKTFVYKIRKTFILYAIMPIFLLLILFSVFIMLSTNSSIKSRIKEAGVEIGIILDGLNKNYKKECMGMAAEDMISDFIQNGSGSSRIFEEYYAYTLAQELSFDMTIMNIGGEVLLSTDKKENIWKGSAITRLTANKELVQEEPTMVYGRLKTEFGILYYYGFGMIVYQGQEPVGYLIYYTEDQLLKSLMETKGVDGVVLTNRFGSVLATTMEQARSNLNKLVFQPDDEGVFQLNGKNFFMSEYLLEDDGMVLLTISGMEERQYIFRLLPMFILFIMVLQVGILTMLSKRMGAQAIGPVEELLKVVVRTQGGDLQASVQLDTGDEFETLANEYNQMIYEVNHLIGRNEELFELRKEAEFAVLRNQFNPHFIFNVLETLRYTLLVDMKQAEEIIISLSQFLRYNIYVSDKLVPLGEDIEHLENYLKLHKARFQERMQYEIVLPEDVDEVLVPKFFTQPFIENSIKHGFRVRDRFKVTVQIEKQEECLMVWIRDNAGGMTAERFAEVTGILMNSEGEKGHVGLYNMDRTFKLLYGAEYGISLLNDAGIGLTVSIRIPDNEGDGDV
ncbi:MAG: sensor histidine kinase [Lachnospiraceae bacterium]